MARNQSIIVASVVLLVLFVEQGERQFYSNRFASGFFPCIFCVFFWFKFTLFASLHVLQICVLSNFILYFMCFTLFISSFEEERKMKKWPREREREREIARLLCNACAMDYAMNTKWKIARCHWIVWLRVVIFSIQLTFFRSFESVTIITSGIAWGRFERENEIPIEEEAWRM